MNIAEFLTRFNNARPSGKGYQVRCPAHEDRVASLSVSNGGGKILLKCHAGCRVEAIVEAIGLRMSDLFDEPREPRQNGNGQYFKGGKVIAAYEYKDAAGNLVYRVLRNEHKNFAQQRLENGQWVWKGPDKKLLYRLPEILQADPEQPVFIVEGEKDVDETLRPWGFIATCNSGGAGKFFQDNEALRGRLVVTIEDNDQAGAEHIADVSRKLKGVARQIVNLKLDGLPEKGDVTDWKRQGHTRDELLGLVDALLTAPKPQRERFATSETLLRPKELSLMGLAARFHERYYRETRYVEPRGAFYNYADGVWRASYCSAEAKTKHIINEIHDESQAVEKRVAELKEKQKAGDISVLGELSELVPYFEALAKFSSQIKKPRTMSEILNFTRSDLRIEADDFDPNHSILNLKNGTVDLETGKFYPHKPGDLCSMQSPVVYDATAGCDRWKRFLVEIFLGDQTLIDFLQRMIGYSISGHASEQIFLILHGDGSNGKSELLWVLEQILGSYIRAANVDTFMEDKTQGGHNEDIARLRGCRVVTTSETEKSKRLAEALVKRLTGNETITASYKHERTFEFVPRFKVWLAANHKPNITGTDFGIWRRILLMPFLAKFLKPGVDLENGQFRIDPNLRTDILKEIPGILNWAIKGYQEWRKQGLNPPQVVKAASEDYRIESDKLGAFLNEEMIPNTKNPAALNAAYQAYRKWAENGGMKPASIRGFAADLRARGIEVKKAGVKNDMSVIGYALLSRQEPADEYVVI